MCHEKAQLVIARKGGVWRVEESKDKRKRKAREKERMEKKGRTTLFCLYSAKFLTVRTDKPCAAFNSTLFLNCWACIDEINALQSIL